MARSQSTSSGSTDLDPSTSTEEKGRDSVDGAKGYAEADELPGGDPEKQPAGLRRVATRVSNTQAVPGVQLDESDFEDGGSDHHAQSAHEDRGGGGSGVLGLAERVLSRTTSKSSFNPGPPPDGGLRAWTVVATGHLVIMNTWGKAGALVEWAAFKELEYTFYAAGSFTCFLGVYFAFYYLASYSRDIIGLSYVESLNLLLLLNGIGIIGRLVPNYLADRWGAINIFVPTAIIAGVCQLTWIAVTDPPGLYAWAVFFGIAAGGIQSLFPAGLSSLTTDLRKSGTRMGMVFTIVSFATLTGPPIAGAIISSCGGQYYGAQAFAGCAMIVGGGFMAAAKVVKQRKVGGGWKTKV
ncbi:hypothetical protein INS49_013695 [Diaporthe citri]|uniref:uncharacterized protein n=1 Tax=Diaporthe citri TaxID=83186 RepID=UPI001C82759F|nr:uncharacterized protein INS49_013695 [Diaporthe citri]KAG6357816.1 hypothetical protein INS49_013695 [Diaporthe citri]